MLNPDTLRADVRRALCQVGRESALDEVLGVIKKVGGFALSERKIHLQIKEEQLAFQQLKKYLALAVKSATRVDTFLTDVDGAPFSPRIKEILDCAALATPSTATGRPTTMGPGHVALGIWGALVRAGVPPRKLAATTTACLTALEMEQKQIEGAVKRARAYMKSIKVRPD